MNTKLNEFLIILGKWAKKWTKLREKRTQHNTPNDCASLWLGRQTLNAHISNDDNRKYESHRERTKATKESIQKLQPQIHRTNWKTKKKSQQRESDRTNKNYSNNITSRKFSSFILVMYHRFWYARVAKKSRHAHLIRYALERKTNKNHWPHVLFLYFVMKIHTYESHLLVDHWLKIKRTQ